jgi:hypothetical protein
MIRYTFASDPAIGLKNAKRADPQRIGEALEKIASENGGTMPSEAIVTAAQARRHTLHPHFEWDDGRAAHAHRLEQARHLVQIIRVVDDTDHNATPHRAYLSIRSGREGRRYVPTAQVLDSVQLQLEVLRQAEIDLQAWERRYSELHDVCSLVRVARERLQGRRRDLGGDDDRPSAH